MFFLPMIHTFFACSPIKDNVESTSDSVIEYPSLPSLDDEITTIMNEESIPGVSTCIVKDGEPVWCNGYGYANVDVDVHADADADVDVDVDVDAYVQVHRQLADHPCWRHCRVLARNSRLLPD